MRPCPSTADSPDPAPASTHGAEKQPAGTGIALVLGCYTLWGAFPLYFRLLSEAGSVEIIGHRIVWTLATCLVLVAARRRWGRLRRVLRTPHLLGALAASGLLISINWLIYVYGVNTARTADAALGYFINPLVTVALASLVLRERLRPV
ncbi:EamA family transporter, partial [Actinomyces massiliensis]